MSKLRTDNLANLDGTVDYPIGEQPASTIRDPESLSGAVNLVSMFGADPNGVIDSSVSVSNAVAFCVANSVRLYWPRGNYIVSVNLTDFHSVYHFGPGVLVSNGKEWRPEMGLFDVNRLYVSPSGSDINDGLSPQNPLTPLGAFHTLREIPEISEVGQYSIVFAGGTYTSRGIRTSRAQFSSRPLLIQAADGESPIWSGIDNVESYAINGDANSAFQYLEIKGIYFRDWALGSSIFDGNVNIKYDSCDFSGMGDTGIWVRQGRANVKNCNFEDISNDAARFQYQTRANLGHSTFANVGTAGHWGRNSAGHFHHNKVDHAKNAVYLAYVSRVRTYGNTYGSNIYNACVVTDGNSVWNSNDFGNDSDDFSGISGKCVPWFNSGGGSIAFMQGQNNNGVVFRGDYRFGSALPISANTKTNLVEEGVISNEWLRLPKLAMSSPQLQVEIVVHYSLSSNTTATIDIHAPGSSISTRVSSLTIGPHSDSLKGKAVLGFGGSYLEEVGFKAWSERFDNSGFEFNDLNYTYDSTGIIRSLSCEVLPWRFYVTTDNPNGTLIRYIEVRVVY